MSLSVCIITHNEEANIGRTLESVTALLKETPGEIIVVDSGSTDRTVEIARSHGAKVFTEAWKGYAAQKNSAIEKASGDWVLSLDADEEISKDLSEELLAVDAMTRSSEKFPTHLRRLFEFKSHSGVSPLPDAYLVPRKNFFLGRWIKRGGFYPDAKIRLFRRGAAKFDQRAVHETISFGGRTGRCMGTLLHYAYPTLAGYIGHMNKYSSLGAQQAVEEGKRGFSLINIVLRPPATFIYNYIFRLGFLDGREGLLLHFYHAAYTSWKYAKVWELTRTSQPTRTTAGG